MANLTKNNLERWYLQERLTMQEIGEKVGCTRQNVHYALRRLGIGLGTAERFKAKCDVCGREYEITRARFKASDGHYCGKECYKTYLRSPEYRNKVESRRKFIRGLEEAGRNVPEKIVVG